MPEGDKSTPQGAPAPSPAPVSGITGTPAPKGLDAGGGGQQAPASAGTADAPQGQGTSPQPAKGAPWTQDQREEHIQTLYQKQKAELDAYKALGASPDQLAEKLKAQQTVASSAGHPSGGTANVSSLQSMAGEVAPEFWGTVLQRIHEEKGELAYAQALAEMVRNQTPQAQPASGQPQAGPNIADLETRMEQIANRTVRSSTTKGYAFQKRLNNFAAPLGGGNFLQAEILVETPQGQIRMTREEAVHKYNDWANDQGRPVQDIREILREVDPAGLQAIDDRKADERAEKRLLALQASGQPYIGHGGVPQAVQPGMASPNAALHEGLTRTAVASDRFGLNSLKKPEFAPGT